MYFIQISDSHIGPDADYTLYGVNTAATLRDVVAAINQWHQQGQRIDCVVHTGDITTDGDTADHQGRSAQLAAEILGELVVPLHCLNGNHDDIPSIDRLLPDTRERSQEHRLAGILDYTDCRLLFLDARPQGGVPADPAGHLDDTQLALCQQALSGPQRVAVFLHYPPLPLDCRWMDERMLIDNGSRLHDLLAKHRERVCGVFFGHVHNDLQCLIDGVLYSATGGLSCHFPAWPGQSTPAPTALPAATLKYVHAGSQPTLIKALQIPIRLGD